jgi:hypothetical protein
MKKQPSPSTKHTKTTTYPTIPVPGSSGFNNKCARIMAVQTGMGIPPEDCNLDVVGELRAY